MEEPRDHMDFPPEARRLDVDRLGSEGPSLEVLLVRDASFGTAADEGPRPPHRHDYHELIWTRCGTGHHLIDGEVVEVQPNTITLIGRGQVHVFESASGVYGAVVRFGDELLHGEAEGRPACSWMLARRGAQTVQAPPSDVPRLEAVIEALAAESRRPIDGFSADLERHLLSVLLMWTERWYDSTRTRRRGADDADVELYRRFTELLERDYVRHHDVGHYADALRVPAAALSRSLSSVTGRGTKQHITERVMLEAARLLRFTDLTVGEIAFRVGLEDQLYFSRSFKRRYGESPLAYRESSRGRTAA